MWPPLYISMQTLPVEIFWSYTSDANDASILESILGEGNSFPFLLNCQWSSFAWGEFQWHGQIELFFSLLSAWELHWAFLFPLLATFAHFCHFTTLPNFPYFTLLFFLSSPIFLTLPTTIYPFWCIKCYILILYHFVSLSVCVCVCTTHMNRHLQLSTQQPQP